MLVLAAALAAAETPPLPPPVHHGVLQLPHPADGLRYHPADTGRVTVRGWRFFVSPDSDGIFPDREPIVVAIGAQTFFVPAGQMRARAHGRIFVFRAGRTTPPGGVRYLRLARIQSGLFDVRMRVREIDLRALRNDVELCMPGAVIVGDDDAFSGIQLRTPGFEAKTFTIDRPCDPKGSWPWLGLAGPSR